MNLVEITELHTKITKINESCGKMTCEYKDEVGVYWVCACSVVSNSLYPWTVAL